MDKKIGLEHTIRNIMTESVGAIGTDKFTKTSNSFFRSFHAEPKKGDTHPNNNAVRASRNVQKERSSTTMNTVTEEEQLDEFKAPPVAPTIPKPRVEPKIKPKVDEPEVQPSPKPSEPEVQPSPKPSEPEVRPSPTPKSPEEAPKDAPKIKQEPEGTSKTGGVTKIEPTGKENSGLKPQGSNLPNTKTNSKTTTRGKAPRFPIISFPLSVNPLTGTYGGTNVRTVMHTPEERLGESTDADNIRRSIENVARPTSKNKLTKLAEIKTKIIDENVRKANIVRKAIQDKKANSHIDTKPKLKDLELDEKLLPRAATVGAAGAVGYGGALEGPRKTFDKYKTPEEQEKALKGQKDPFGVPNERYGGVDVVTDVASMFPIVGTPAALYGAKRAYDRGDYTDTALNLASAIPGVGTGIKALKFLGKGLGTAGKALQKGGTVASDIASGAQLGDIPYQVNKMSQETGENKTDLYKGIANTFYSDIKTDVVEPIVKKLKKPSIEVFGGPTSSASGKKLSQ
jgi:hypothetical protein